MPRPPSSSGSGFRNFQNYLYWSQDSSGHSGVKGGENKNAYASFSFTAGYKGSNVAPNFLYAMAMIPGPPPRAPYDWIEPCGTTR